MTVVKSIPLDEVWKARLDLSSRGIPELYETADSVRNTLHAGALRAALDDLGMSAVFCVQGVPTVAILYTHKYDRDRVIELHASLWNQGLASLLLVITGDTARAFSLARKPYVGLEEEFDHRCLIRTLHATADALALKNLVYGAESGRLWSDNSYYFRQKERIDQVLLGNLSESHRLLRDANLSSDAAEALLIQTMFIAYLEDRGITDSEHFLDASNGASNNFSSLLDTGDSRLLGRLFKKLRAEFNGDLFVAPCSFEASSPPPKINKAHLRILARFRTGREEFAQGGSQYRFWGYSFKYIPIELISAVYDHFLGKREVERRNQGAYYTPMFLADTVVSQVWDALPLSTKEKGFFLDPACGSGVFLVRAFQRLCESWRENRKSQTIRWDSLRAILSRLHGWDLNSGSVRVAVFSLYIALLEEVSPPDIRTLARRGRMLPELWGKNLRCQDFFTVRTDDAKFDVVFGNPPWASRRGPNRSSVEWCSAEGSPMPGKEDAWAFTWKSLRHLRNNGIVAFLLPAMGFLHNHAKSSVAARNRLMREARIRRIINFSDLRFQLFDGAVRPAALIIMGQSDSETPHYRFEYLVPKADLNLKVRRLITLSSADKSSISYNIATEDPLVFKRRLWMREPDAKLFNYLSGYPKLGDLINTYGTQRRKGTPRKNQWLIGQGFQPFNAVRTGGQAPSPFVSEFVNQLPFLPISHFQTLAQSVHGLAPWPSSQVRRKGFEQGFSGPRILIPRGVNTAQMRLRAAYVEASLTFQDIIQAIVVPSGEEGRAKLLTALLNSKLALWFAFHGTSSFGSDRPEVKQAELMHLPFPSPGDTPSPEQSRRAARKLVQIIDKALAKVDKPFALQRKDGDLLDEIDRLTYEYFCLSDDEIILIDDGAQKLIPAAQPSQGSFPEIWKPAGRAEREAYASTLARSLKDWFDDECAIQVVLEAANADLAIMRLTLSDNSKSHGGYIEENDRSVRDALSDILKHIHEPLPGNFQLMPDFRLFVGKYLYVVKPIWKRFWLRSAALADADAIALDLQDTVELRKRQGHG